MGDFSTFPALYSCRTSGAVATIDGHEGVGLKMRQRAAGGKTER